MVFDQGKNMRNLMTVAEHFIELSNKETVA